MTTAKPGHFGKVVKFKMTVADATKAKSNPTSMFEMANAIFDTAEFLPGNHIVKWLVDTGTARKLLLGVLNIQQMSPNRLKMKTETPEYRQLMSIERKTKIMLFVG